MPHGSFGAVYTENAEYRQTVEYFIILIVTLVLAVKLAQLHTPRREKHLTAIRARAREVGLRVEWVSDLLRVDAAGAVPAVRYLLPWPLSFDTGAGFIPWGLVRDVRRGRESPWGGWHWHSTPAPELVRAGLGEILASLPCDVAAVQCDRSGLSIYWSEQEDMDSVAKLLNGLENIRNNYIKHKVKLFN